MTSTPDFLTCSEQSIFLVGYIPKLIVGGNGFLEILACKDIDYLFTVLLIICGYSEFLTLIRFLDLLSYFLIKLFLPTVTDLAATSTFTYFTF